MTTIFMVFTPSLVGELETLKWARMQVRTKREA